MKSFRRFAHVQIAKCVLLWTRRNTWLSLENKGQTAQWESNEISWGLHGPTSTRFMLPSYCMSDLQFAHRPSVPNIALQACLPSFVFERVPGLKPTTGPATVRKVSPLPFHEHVENWPRICHWQSSCHSTMYNPCSGHSIVMWSLLFDRQLKAQRGLTQNLLVPFVRTKRAQCKTL
jgi:hypothetical protein